MDLFAVLAEPTRRRILEQLVRTSRSVNELSSSLDVAQPAMSKHLKVLREAGYVSCRGSAQQRIYQLEPRPFRALDAWLEPYRRFWTHHLDALERHLDRQEELDEKKKLPARKASKRRSASRRKSLDTRLRS